MPPDLLSLGALVVLAYTYAGYPLAIAALARLRPFRRENAHAHDPETRPWPTVSILLPVANAAPWLPAKLDSLLTQDYPPDRLRLLVYADSPRDGSDAVLSAFAARDPRITVERSPTRRGKPHALNHLRRHATGEILILTDARQPLSRTAVRDLVRRLADPTVACAAGRLVLAGAAGSGAYWRYETFIRRAEARFRSQIGASGALYAVRRADLPQLPEDTILDDVWIPMLLRLDGRRIAACDEAAAYDTAFDDAREFQRKVRTLAGNYQLFARLPALLLPWRNPSWFETLSHRFLRLVCPWALLVLAVASIAGARSPLCAVLAAGQACFYLLAALGRRAGRAGSLARTFVVLNAAAVVGLWRWATGRQRIAW